MITHALILAHANTAAEECLPVEPDASFYLLAFAAGFACAVWAVYLFRRRT